MRQMAVGGLLGLLLGRLAIELGVSVWPIPNDWLRAPVVGQFVNLLMGFLGAGVGGLRVALGSPSLFSSALGGYALGCAVSGIIHGYFSLQMGSDEFIQQMRAWPEMLREVWGLLGMLVGAVLAMLPPGRPQAAPRD